MSRIRRLIKGIINSMLLRTSYRHLMLDIELETHYLGNSYGGFSIAPKYLKSKDAVLYSIGIGEDISFDLDFLRTYSGNVFAYDPTPKTAAFLASMDLPKEFNFWPKALSVIDEEREFLLPKNDEHVSGSLIENQELDIEKSLTVVCRSLRTLMAENAHQEVDILKLDIEGSEYEVLDSILRQDIKIKQICVEIHDRFYAEGPLKSKQLLAQLRKHNYLLFSVSGNLQELSFILNENIEDDNQIFRV